MVSGDRRFQPTPARPALAGRADALALAPSTPFFFTCDVVVARQRRLLTTPACVEEALAGAAR